MSGTLTVVAAGASGTTTADSADAAAAAQTTADVATGLAVEAAASKAAVKTKSERQSHLYPDCRRLRPDRARQHPRDAAPLDHDPSG